MKKSIQTPSDIKDINSRANGVAAAIGTLLAAFGVCTAAAQATCKERICVEIQRVSDVGRPLLRARALISLTGINDRFRHYNVSIEGGQQFELKGQGPANYGPLPIELHRGQHNFSVQACSRAPGELGFFEASDVHGGQIFPIKSPHHHPPAPPSQNLPSAALVASVIRSSPRSPATSWPVRAQAAVADRPMSVLFC